MSDHEETDAMHDDTDNDTRTEAPTETTSSVLTPDVEAAIGRVIEAHAGTRTEKFATVDPRWTKFAYEVLGLLSALAETRTAKPDDIDARAAVAVDVFRTAAGGRPFAQLSPPWQDVWRRVAVAVLKEAEEAARAVYATEGVKDDGSSQRAAAQAYADVIARHVAAAEPPADIGQRCEDTLAILAGKPTTLQVLREIARLVKSVPHSDGLMVWLGTDDPSGFDAIHAIDGSKARTKPYQGGMLEHAWVDIDGVEFRASFVRPMTPEERLAEEQKAQPAKGPVQP